DTSRKGLGLGIGGGQPDPAGRLRGGDLGDGDGLPVAGARDHERYPALAGTPRQGSNPWAGQRRRTAWAAPPPEVRGPAPAGSVNQAPTLRQELAARRISRRG